MAAPIPARRGRGRPPRRMRPQPLPCRGTAYISRPPLPSPRHTHCAVCVRYIYTLPAYMHMYTLYVRRTQCICATHLTERVPNRNSPIIPLKSPYSACNKRVCMIHLVCLGTRRLKTVTTAIATRTPGSSGRKAARGAPPHHMPHLHGLE